jgi:predicted outer membrane repeat protein
MDPNNMRRKHPALAFCVLALACAASVPASAANFEVDSSADSGTGSLRAAITLANASAGPHTIDIRVRGEQAVLALQSPLPVITVNDLSIIATESTGFVIDGQDEHRIFELASSNESFQLTGMSLRRGRASEGGCVRGSANALAQLRIEDVLFEACTATAGDGGAIRVPAGPQFESGLEILSSRFVGNAASAHGGAVSAAAGGVSFRASIFMDNVAAADGGAVSVRGASVNFVFVDDGHFADNAGGTRGGAIDIQCNFCNANFQRGYFGGNSAGEGGALAMSASGAEALSLRIDNFTFDRNSALGQGGALSVSGLQLTANGLTLQGNRAASGAHLSAGSGFALARLRTSLWAGVDPAGGGACSFANQLLNPGQRVDNLFADTASCAPLAEVGGSALTGSVAGTLDAQDGAMPVLVFSGNSQIIDGGSTGCDLTVDARNGDRPIDGSGDGESECDIGAYEHPLQSDELFDDGFEGN